MAICLAGLDEPVQCLLTCAGHGLRPSYWTQSFGTIIGLYGIITAITSVTAVRVTDLSGVVKVSIMEAQEGSYLGQEAAVNRRP